MKSTHEVQLHVSYIINVINIRLRKLSRLYAVAFSTHASQELYGLTHVLCIDSSVILCFLRPNFVGMKNSGISGRMESLLISSALGTNRNRGLTSEKHARKLEKC